ncbi:hypothetical protein [Polymorphobacter sp. PAMC 29334]|uniref:hypothetical protein n=1 Tax=Polymorphobacter sp. PAMC 29334 TaxID=2862331 RepID=UPI001D0239E1|nr:hypothetical protein [Polymorphobacter sp. PAMC 29334]
MTEIATLLGVSRQAIYRRLEADQAAVMLAEASYDAAARTPRSVVRAIHRAGRS